MKREVTLVQEKESQELAQKISKSSYQFQCKGHEHQFNFNATVQELIAAARSELVKVTPMEDREKEALQKVEASLDEGAKSLATRQKDTQFADRSEYGWATYHEVDPLASNSDDEKCINKTKKEAQEDADKRVSTKKEKGCGKQLSMQAYFGMLNLVILIK